MPEINLFELEMFTKRRYKELMRRAMPPRTRFKFGNVLSYSLEEFAAKVAEALRNGQCGYCKGDLTVRNFSPDHIIPICRGGTHRLDNIQIVCWDCNVYKGYMSHASFKKLIAPTRIANIRARIFGRGRE